MKKKIKENLIYILSAVLFFAGMLVFIWLNVLQNDAVKKQLEDEANITFNTIIAHACEIYPLAEAQKLLGDEVKYEDTTIGAESNDDIEVSACSYSTPFKNADELSAAQTSSILIRSAKTPTGAILNRRPFETEKPQGVIDVQGYGEFAYWNQSRSQLNVYKDGNWLIFSAGPLNVNRRSLEDTRKLADIIIPKI